MVGMTFLLYTIPFILLGAAGGRLADRRGAARMTVIGIFMTVPLVFVYGLLNSAWLLVGFAIVEGVIGALTIPAAQSLMAQVAPKGRASAAQGLSGAGDLMAGVLMSLIAPVLYGSSESVARGGLITFGFAALMMAICGTAVALMLRPTADSRSATN
jgi:MFS family permease